jgi:hypothetical protein
MNQINVIPASIQRVRRFLAGQGGMNIEPWAGVDETLDAFHDLLVSRRLDDAFWKELEALLASLTDDMRTRMSVKGRAVVDNEVLDPGRHDALLAEIRSALDGRTQGRGGFRRLASALSMPAVGMLVVMGGVATAGCEDKSSSEDAVEDALSDFPAETAVDPVPDPEPEPAEDPAAELDAATDVECSETMSDIVELCVSDAGQRTQILECLDSLHESWHTELEEFLACAPCDSVQFWLVDCLLDGFREACTDPSSAGTFDLDAFIDNCSTPIYLGLRFV